MEGASNETDIDRVPPSSGTSAGGITLLVFMGLIGTAIVALSVFAIIRRRRARNYMKVSLDDDTILLADTNTFVKEH